MLNSKERAILDTLDINPFISQKELADLIGLSRSATANLISGLVSKGYILGKAYILNKQRTIVCIGAANIDHKLELKGPVEFHTSNPVTTSTAFGGVIRNVAENLGRLDQNVSLLTLVGKDKNGEYLLNYCKDYMSIHEVETLDGYSTGMYSALLDKEGDLLLGIADMDITTKMDKEWLNRHRNHLVTSEILVADTNIEKDALEYLVEFSRENSQNLIMIGVSAPKTDRVPDDLEGLELTIFNKDESQTYFQTDETDTNRLVKLWLAKGVKNAIVTEGKHGVFFGSIGKDVQHIPAIQNVKVRDATGAGDAFSSGIIYGYMNNKTLLESVQYGQLNAVATLQSLTSVRSDLTAHQLEQEKENYDAK